MKLSERGTAGGIDLTANNGVRVVTAIALTSEEKSHIANQIAGMTEREMGSIVYKVNPELIGGAIIQIGDKVLDGSIRRSLEPLREEMTFPEA
jgi:F-type H+-transporting ATPase subunit delta